MEDKLPLDPEKRATKKHSTGNKRAVIRACEPCNRMKKRCNASRPCERCVSRGIPEQCIDKATRAEENWQVRKRRVMEAARSGVWSEERSKKMIQLLEHQSVATDVNQLMYSLECESQDESSQSDHTQTKSFTSTPGATFTEKSIKPLTSWTHENQVCTKSSSASLGAADLASTSSTSHAGARRRSSNCEAASAPWLEESGNCTDTCEEHD